MDREQVLKGDEWNAREEQSALLFASKKTKVKGRKFKRIMQLSEHERQTMQEGQEMQTERQYKLILHHVTICFLELVYKDLEKLSSLENSRKPS